jgi:DsbC/DsbD-like thiol-disulfide interchange protein
VEIAERVLSPPDVLFSFSLRTTWFVPTSNPHQIALVPKIPMLGPSIFRSAWFLLAGVAWLVSPLRSATSPAEEHARLELISEQNAIVSDKELWIGVRFDLEDGWHTYWVNPGDSGEPPRFEWELPAGFQVGAIQWPYPTRISTPPFADYGYEHQVLLMVTVRPTPGLKEGVSERIAARVHYLVCRDVCIPGQKQLELTLPVKSDAAASSTAQGFETTRLRLPQPVRKGWKISAASVGDEFLLDLRIGTLNATPQFFPLEEEQVENAAVQAATTIPGGIRLHLKKSNHLLKPISRLKGVLVVASGKAYMVDVPVQQPSRKAQTVSMRD